MQVFLPFPQVVLQEVPGEISLGFMVRGCPLQCQGCSYKSLKDWQEMDIQTYTQILDRYRGLCSCVVFMGGEWNTDLPLYLQQAQQRGFLTCLYTGRELAEISPVILQNLDFIKVGRWAGIPLGEQGSNQRFWKLPEMQDLTDKFSKRFCGQVHSQPERNYLLLKPLLS